MKKLMRTAVTKTYSFGLVAAFTGALTLATCGGGGGSINPWKQVLVPTTEGASSQCQGQWQNAYGTVLKSTWKISCGGAFIMGECVNAYSNSIKSASSYTC